MEQKDRMRQKFHSATSAFTPRSLLVQRYCACGGVAGIDDLCEQCRSQRLSGQRGTRSFLEPSWSTPPGYGVPGASPQPIEAMQPLSGGSRFGHDFRRIPVHAPPSEPIQAKLIVSQPGDQYEQEADQVAEQVMPMSPSETLEDPDVSGSSQTHVQRVSPWTEVMRRQSEPEDEEWNSEPIEEEEETLQAKESAGHTPTVTPELDTRIHSMRGGGQPLDAATRAYMEPRFGHDFSRVRIHTEERAAETARAVNALAYTVGRDMVFEAGKYVPKTPKGLHLLAHELTHVIQQERQTIPLIQRQVAEPQTVPAQQGEGVQQAGGSPGTESPELTAKLDDIVKRYRSMIKAARYLGWNVAADNLERFLAGTAGTEPVPLPVPWLRGFFPVVFAERVNQMRFEQSLFKLRKQLQHGDKKDFHDYWDCQLKASPFTELQYASGTSIIKSTGDFTLERIENTIHVSGNVTHHWFDPYDWHPWLLALIPGFGMISDTDALLLQEHRGAKPFYMVSDWRQTVNGTINIGTLWDNDYYTWTGP